MLQKAGVEGVFAALLDINMAQAWKPARESYAFACGQLGLRPDQVGACTACLGVIDKHNIHLFQEYNRQRGMRSGMQEGVLRALSTRTAWGFGA